jgi:two-component system, OmpR family, KDP operon response regulator KdpE
MAPGTPLRVLLVDDEQAIRRFLRLSFDAEGYQVDEAGDGKSALYILRTNAPDLLILDLGLPDLDGFEVIRQLRDLGSSIPIVVLSIRTDEKGKVEALDLGADDYATKPFGIDELLARTRTALRHRLQQQGEKPVFRSGDLALDLVRRKVKVGDREVRLSPAPMVGCEPSPSSQEAASRHGRSAAPKRFTKGFFEATANTCLSQSSVDASGRRAAGSSV